MDVLPPTVRRMRRNDWDWVQEWYRDPVLDRELGPLDEEWLNYVLGDHPGAELVVEHEGAPIGLVGVAWGHDDLPHAITDIAVDPDRRGGGGAGRSSRRCRAGHRSPTSVPGRPMWRRKTP